MVSGVWEEKVFYASDGWLEGKEPSEKKRNF